MTKAIIGFIGQGYIGKNYADDFEKRGFEVVRYANEEPYIKNKDKISQCDVVFIAVPTPTTPQGFDDSIIRSVVSLVGRGKIAVIKSTIVPGTTESIQKENPDIFVMHSPEFLTEATAASDAGHPDRNIVGIPVATDLHREKAKEVIALLPKAPFELVCAAKEAELIKYGGNCWFYLKVVFINMLYDLSKTFDTNWTTIQNALTADSRIGPTHLNPIHKSGRGAGGHCFIKDFEAFIDMYKKQMDLDALGISALEQMREKNIDLLTKSNKDMGLLQGVYGKNLDSDNRSV